MIKQNIPQRLFYNLFFKNCNTSTRRACIFALIYYTIAIITISFKYFSSFYFNYKNSYGSYYNDIGNIEFTCIHYG